jgi:hypothetical protein
MIRSYRECGVNENIRSSGRLFVKRKSFLKKKKQNVSERRTIEVKLLY